MQQSFWAELSPEVWAAVFSSLQPDQLPLHSLTDGWEQKWFYKLQTVCKSFIRIFKTHPELYSILVPSSRRTNKCQLAALTDWGESHSGPVKTKVDAPGGPSLEAAVAGLQLGMPVMTRVMLSQCPAEAILLLATFKCLSECVLSSVGPKLSCFYSLAPVRGLPLLTKLVLEGGTYDDVGAAEHLTSLQLINASGDCSRAGPRCCFAKTLLELRLRGAGLFSFHEGGITACGGLQLLECHGGGIYGYDTRDT